MENIQSNSPMMQDIRRENGWSRSELQKEIKRRKVVLSYLVDNDINEYVDVSSILQGYMYSKDAVLAKIADMSLATETGKFRSIKNIDINIDPSLEEGVPRPTAEQTKKAKARDILKSNKDVYEDISANMDQIEDQLGDILELEGESREVAQEEDVATGLTYGDSTEDDQKQEKEDSNDENSEFEYGYRDNETTSEEDN